VRVHPLVAIAIALLLAVLTVAFIAVAAPLFIAYLDWVVERDWNTLATLVALALPFVVLLTALFSLELLND
jgi:hypothetical protein